MRVPERYYEDEEGIQRGKCPIHGEFIVEGFGCPDCLDMTEEYEAERREENDRKEAEKVIL